MPLRPRAAVLSSLKSNSACFRLELASLPLASQLLPVTARAFWCCAGAASCGQLSTRSLLHRACACSPRSASVHFAKALRKGTADVNRTAYVRSTVNAPQQRQVAACTGTSTATMPARRMPTQASVFVHHTIALGAAELLAPWGAC
eukprot:TRINITY_DN2243_c1_g2_i3.p1 TRINITY_DN2243_c1_g2~~TRINITY_DN2243_c1_g2_i3.p1  ORF type:complete len:146 (-),score=14.36 TRINITY_DN2243_c1_g2_i3:723-1160(-)